MKTSIHPSDQTLFKSQPNQHVIGCHCVLTLSEIIWKTSMHPNGQPNSNLSKIDQIMGCHYVLLLKWMELNEDKYAP